MSKSYFDEHGRELPDDTPIAKPVRFNRPGSTLDEIRRNLGLAQKLAEQEGMETFEEADDFDVGDDMDPSHPYEHEVDNRNQFFENLRDEFRAAAAAPPPPSGDGIPGAPPPVGSRTEEHPGPPITTPAATPSPTPSTPQTR